MPLFIDLAPHYGIRDIRVFFHEKPIVLYKKAPTHIYQSVFFKTYRKSIHIRKHLFNDRFYIFISISWFMLLYEPCIFRKSAGIKKKRNIVLVGNNRNFPDIFH